MSLNDSYRPFRLVAEGVFVILNPEISLHTFLCITRDTKSSFLFLSSYLIRTSDMNRDMTSWRIWWSILFWYLHRLHLMMLQKGNSLSLKILVLVYQDIIDGFTFSRENMQRWILHLSMYVHAFFNNPTEMTSDLVPHHSSNLYFFVLLS